MSIKGVYDQVEGTFNELMRETIEIEKRTKDCPHMNQKYSLKANLFRDDL